MLSVFDQGPPQPCPAPFNLAAHVLRRAPDLGGKIALSVVQGETSENWTFAQLESAVRGTGTGLLKSGLRPGDIVLMRLGNTVDFPIAYLGAIAAGLVPVPTSSQLTQHEVADIVATLSPAAILRDPTIASSPGPAEIALHDLQQMSALPPCDYAMGSPDRLAYVVYTSGTSGKPRAVAHAHRAIWARQMMIEDWYGLREQDRLMHAGAFNWTYTLGTGLMDPWTMGATALIPQPGTDLAALPELLSKHQASIFAAAPGVYRKILMSDMKFPPQLRHGLSAGEKLSEKLRAHWRQATGTELYEAFGMSECSTFISSCPAHPAPPGALGKPQNGRRVAILGDDGPQPIGTPGQIAVHESDPGLMLTYLGAEDEAQSRFQGPWFGTGDQGIMREDGYIDYLGRGDDMMNAGGYRVSPLEVEAALSHCPGIDQIAVAEVEVKSDVRVIVAFYTGAQTIDEAQLKAFAEQDLARYKQPRAYVHVDVLPTNANGKVVRKKLAQMFGDDTK